MGEKKRETVPGGPQKTKTWNISGKGDVKGKKKPLQEKGAHNFAV